MNFELSEELKMLRDMAYKFAVAEIAPISHECDVEEKYTPEIRKKAAEQGLVGAWIPEQYGGAGVGILGNTIITEEVSRVDMGIGLNIGAASFGCEAIFFFGTEEQKMKYLPPVCRGEWVAAGAFTEPNAGTDVAGYKTKGIKDGNDFVINGNKMFITNGSVCDFMVAQVSRSPKRRSTTASARSSFRRTPRELLATSSTAKWGSGRATRRRSRSRTCGCRRRTWSGKRAGAFTS